MRERGPGMGSNSFIEPAEPAYLSKVPGQLSATFLALHQGSIDRVLVLCQCDNDEVQKEWRALANPWRRTLDSH